MKSKDFASGCPPIGLPIALFVLAMVDANTDRALTTFITPLLSSARSFDDRQIAILLFHPGSTFSCPLISFLLWRRGRSMITERRSGRFIRAQF
jgi:hypothetical protein